MKKENTKKTRALGTAGIILLCIYYVAACAYIPLSIFSGMDDRIVSVISLGACVVSVVALAKAARTYRAVLGYAVIIGFFVFFGGSLLPVGLFAAFASAVCVYAYLIIKHPSPFLWGLPAIPLVLGILFSDNILCAVLSVCTVPAALLLMYSVKKRLPRIGAVCRISFGICAMVAIGFAVSVYNMTGELSLAAAKQLLDAMREQLVSIIILTSESMEQTVGFELTVDIDQYASVIVTSMLNLFPAIIIILGNVAAYLIHSMFLGICFSTEEEQKQALPMLSFDMSMTSAIVFIASLVLTFALSSDSLAMYGAAAENIMVILCPGLILTALGALRALSARKGPSCLGTIVYIAVILMLASLSPFAIIGTALAGAVVLIAAHIANAKSKGNTTK